VAKQKFKITNWPTYNKALINRGSITFWLDDEAIPKYYPYIREKKWGVENSVSIW
jgi:hypothetical protein